jgi:hypothetical protein
VTLTIKKKKGKGIACVAESYSLNGENKDIVVIDACINQRKSISSAKNAAKHFVAYLVKNIVPWLVVPM